ncbi:bifunctional phosphoribosyl-AMP cyclohydrolase/phosphoribosyl-ATP diphosphatase HisIE [Clostridium sp. AM58-1XD]|uniref:bifunctional phosphoribosyl-AMP cyclohydrolase/phosphoribosyl-ATP diphosphatase HisIE n=1 Tax=Clostridium sp. AM58-1XD TaxID=2292307 RepID=UPI000E468EE8|nr:bifunctional phosphoribosyl-AMP cyclohydrolase/phosphoribosyl-ATP diphosphatase HisIE [Clostridium sp. AM58-1XD]RGY99390.1 bifunctional phosphoribosyl-AMP cyclohydrolase/phosphoribosyl-ATP diphosphatase HisIE [Clostridium sp. AM58-1XD]
MDNYKKLIPGFSCKEGQAIIYDEGQVYYSDDILTLCRYYSDNGADEIFIYDASETEEDHENTIGIMKEIARNVDSPLIAGGRVKRLEDVKKYLYAGARAAFLDVSIDENVDLMKEAADRFGSEKIYAYLPEMKYLSNIEEYGQLGASVMILDTDELGDEPVAEDLQRLADSSHPLIVFCDEDKPGALTSYLKIPSVSGVLLSVPEEKEGNCMNTKQELKARGIPVDIFESSVEWSAFKLNSDGLIPVIVQDYKSSEVLMMAYMNKEAYEQTLKTGRMTYYSRSRRQLWLKGETSGHFQYVKSLKLDCDNDTILAKVNQIGAACHTGSRTCFFQTLAEKEYRETNPLKVFEEVYAIIQDRKIHPKEGSYTNYLFDKGIDKILKKVGEEASEIIIAAKNPNSEEVKYEMSDFLYHMMVLMAEKGLRWEDITEELANR